MIRLKFSRILALFIIFIFVSKIATAQFITISLEGGIDKTTLLNNKILSTDLKFDFFSRGVAFGCGINVNYFCKNQYGRNPSVYYILI